MNEHGCSIHGRAPALCRIADCRSLAFRLDYAAARRLHLMGRLDIRVWQQGRKLLEAMRAQKSKRNKAG